MLGNASPDVPILPPASPRPDNRRSTRRKTQTADEAESDEVDIEEHKEMDSDYIDEVSAFASILESCVVLL